jgi:nitrite reductase (cytochrome c-552)
MTDQPKAAPVEPAPRPRGRKLPIVGYLLAIGLTALLTFVVAYVLVTMLQHQWDERQPFVLTSPVHEGSVDPRLWEPNWPQHYDSYARTVDMTYTRYGGSDGAPAPSRLEKDPWLKRMFAGYAFAIDFRERRGHAYMLYDQERTLRVLERPQAGACLHCHASSVVMWRRVGLEAIGKTLADAHGFEWEAVQRGFELTSTIPYRQAHAMLLMTPDGNPEKVEPMEGGTSVIHPTPAHQQPGIYGPTTQEALAAHAGVGHPISCIDCHDPLNMRLRITRPGLMQGLRDLAMSGDAVPHLASIERWRQGNRKEPYNPNQHASRQEMRSFVCAQCHVEYYCGPKATLFFPWGKGLKVEQIEAFYKNHTFPDGTPFYDWEHAETGARVFKAQHPEFEMWSQGIHARAGVACADCHMPYRRQGAQKITDHWIRSPLLMINAACQTCHNVPEDELRARAYTIQDRTHAHMARAGQAIVDMIDAIVAARNAGATPEQLAPILELQNRAQWRLDFVNAENSMGFHAPQEAVRIMGEAIDYARQAQVLANALHTGTVAPTRLPAPSETPRGEEYPR